MTSSIYYSELLNDIIIVDVHKAFDNQFYIMMKDTGFALNEQNMQNMLLTNQYELVGYL